MLLFSGSAVTSHNSLSGLGGILAEYFHLSAAELAIVQATSGTNTGNNAVNTLILGLLLVNKTPWFRLQILKPLTLYLF
jgi:hypothetical protein